MSAWLGGLQIRRTAKGQTPIADFLCTACWTYRRVTGRQKVAEFMRANPIADHRAHCTANPDRKQGAHAA